MLQKINVVLEPLQRWADLHLREGERICVTSEGAEILTRAKTRGKSCSRSTCDTGISPAAYEDFIQAVSPCVKLLRNDLGDDYNLVVTSDTTKCYRESAIPNSAYFKELENVG
jgi:hypothetical protein